LRQRIELHAATRRGIGEHPSRGECTKHHLPAWPGTHPELGKLQRPLQSRRDARLPLRTETWLSLGQSVNVAQTLPSDGSHLCTTLYCPNDTFNPVVRITSFCLFPAGGLVTYTSLKLFCQPR